jgi:hypothetical protein
MLYFGYCIHAIHFFVNVHLVVHVGYYDTHQAVLFVKRTGMELVYGHL